MQPVRHQRLDELGGVVFGDLQVDVGVFTAAGPQHPGGEGMGRSGAGKPDRQLAQPAGREALHALLQQIHALDEAARIGLQLAPGCGQRHALGVALEEGHAQLPFQGADLLAQGGLLQAQLGGRAGDVSGAGNGQEVAQVSNLHMQGVCKSRSMGI